VRDPDGEIVAVLQCINKKNEGVFSRGDQILIEHMASHVGVVLRNAKLYESER
jgi:GAF domain-containing protein